MENEAGMLNLPRVTEQYRIESRLVNSEGGNFELSWRIRPFTIHTGHLHKNLNGKQ